MYRLDPEEAAELREQDRRQRLYQQRLRAHPSCRDPDHPGCENCEAQAFEEEETCSTSTF